jgi:hypothetical protein
MDAGGMGPGFSSTYKRGILLKLYYGRGKGTLKTPLRGNKNKTEQLQG